MTFPLMFEITLDATRQLSPGPVSCECVTPQGPEEGNDTMEKLLEQYALAAFARHSEWQGELSNAGRISANAHAATMEGIKIGGFRSIIQGDDPETGMAYNFANKVPGSNAA
jgi:hypothetical protein